MIRAGIKHRRQAPDWTQQGGDMDDWWKAIGLALQAPEWGARRARALLMTSATWVQDKRLSETVEQQGQPPTSTDPPSADQNPDG